MAVPDILTVAAKHGIALTRRGNEWVGLCPFHQDRNPSLSINAEKDGGVWHCFPCGFGGDVYTLLSKLEGKPRSFYVGQTKKSVALEDLKEELLSLGFKKEDRRGIVRAFRMAAWDLARTFRAADVALDGSLKDGMPWEAFAKVAATKVHLEHLFNTAWDELGYAQYRWRRGEVARPIPVVRDLLSQSRADIEAVSGLKMASQTTDED